MSATNRPSVFSTRLPLSGNAALWASALIQAVIGIEFTLSSLNKLADPHYVVDFAAFVRSTPGAISGVLSSLIQVLVLPNIAIFARLIEVSELLIGVVLLIGAAGYWPAALRRTARRPARLRGAARAGFGTRRSRLRRAHVIDRHPDG